MIKDVELYYPNIVINKDLLYLQQQLEEKNVSFISQKGIYIFNAIPFEGFIESRVVVSFNKKLVKKVLIKSSFENIDVDSTKMVETYHKMLSNIIGTSDTSYKSLDKNIEYNAWYDNNDLVIQTVYDQTKLEFLTLFVMSIKESLSKLNVLKISLVTSFFPSTVSLIVYSIIKRFNIYSFLFFFLVYFTFTIFSYCIMTLKLYSNSKLYQFDTNLETLLKSKIIKQDEKHVSYKGLLMSKKRKIKAILIFTNDKIHLTYLKTNKNILHSYSYEDIIDYSFYYQTFTINFHDKSFDFKLLNLKNTNSLIHDLEYHKNKKRSV